MRGVPRESLRTSSNRLWEMVEEYLEQNPELDLEVGLEVLSYSNVGSFNTAREKRPNLSSSKRERLLHYLDTHLATYTVPDTDEHLGLGHPRGSGVHQLGHEVKSGTAEAAMENVGTAIQLLREAMSELGNHYPQSLWNKDLRELSVLTGQLSRVFVAPPRPRQQGGLRAHSDS